MIFVHDSGQFHDRNGNRRHYEPPRLIELGDIQELTAFDVSVRVP